MVSQKYRGSCIGAALAKWLAKNTVASQKMALEEKMEDGALEMLLKENGKKIEMNFTDSNGMDLSYFDNDFLIGLSENFDYLIDDVNDTVK